MINNRKIPVNQTKLVAGSEKKVKIKEIFSSIQGEGPYVGYKQLFIRFCGCNLNCNYCDTDFKFESGYKEFCSKELEDEVNKYTDIHSISLTGGEPLLYADFLKEFLPAINKPIYLETNATLPDKFLEIKPFIDIVSADIKLESATGINTFELHDKFFEACRGVETFAKIVFNENITDDEILKCCELGKKYGIELILQPETVSGEQRAGSQEGRPLSDNWMYGGMDVRQFNNSNISKIQQKQQIDKDLTSYRPNILSSNMSVSSAFSEQILDKFLQNYEKVRLIPQVHKFLNVR